MQAMRLLPIGLVLLALAFSSTGPLPAEADEGPVAVWIYDVHLVRVDTRAPEIVEKAPDWLKSGSTTVDLSWDALLKDLKLRGKTTVLLDQRVTGVGEHEVMVRGTGDRQIEQFTRRDRNNETWQNSTITQGQSVRLRAQDDLRYDIEVKWALARQEGDMRASLRTTAWSGAHPLLHGGTLALRWAQQSVWESRPPRGVEIYAFVTGRRAR